MTTRQRPMDISHDWVSRQTRLSDTGWLIDREQGLLFAP